MTFRGFRGTLAGLGELGLWVALLAGQGCSFEDDQLAGGGAG